MKKFIWLFLLLQYIFFGCQQNQSLQIKKKISTIYSVKNIDNIFQKDTIKSKYEIGYDKNGEQKYFLGLIGYHTNDTNFTIPQYSKKNVDSVTYYYDKKTNEIEMFTVNKGDSSFQYSILSKEDKPFLEFIYVYNNEKKLIKTIDKILNKVEIYLNTKYDYYNNLIYALVQSDYYPSEFEKKYYSSEELLLKKSQRENYIEENQYTYFK